MLPPKLTFRLLLPLSYFRGDGREPPRPHLGFFGRGRRRQMLTNWVGPLFSAPQKHCLVPCLRTYRYHLLLLLAWRRGNDSARIPNVRSSTHVNGGGNVTSSSLASLAELSSPPAEAAEAAACVRERRRRAGRHTYSITASASASERARPQLAVTISFSVSKTAAAVTPQGTCHIARRG